MCPLNCRNNSVEPDICRLMSEINSKKNSKSISEIPSTKSFEHRNCDSKVTL